jgi:hypothetical protein
MNPARPGYRTEPPWKLPGQPGAFTNDAAMAERRGPHPSQAHNVAEQATYAAPIRTAGIKGLFISIALIAGGVGGYLGAYGPRVAPPDSASTATKGDRTILPEAQVASREAPWTQTPVPRLTVDALRVWRMNEPASLTILCADVGSSANIVIEGLVPGATLLTGTLIAPNAWRLASADASRAAVRPPPGFVGVMNLILELRLDDGTVADRKSLQLEWAGESAVAAPTESSQRRLDASEIAMLMNRGEELVANGNIGAARMMFQPAAEAGDSAAALALAETYDPSALEKMGAKGITPNIAMAQRWYEKAKTLGSPEAPERLVGLKH